MSESAVLSEISARGYARPEVLVSTEWVAQHLNDPGVRIVESNEDQLLYPSGHVPGAVQVDWADFGRTWGKEEQLFTVIRGQVRVDKEYSWAKTINSDGPIPSPTIASPPGVSSKPVSGFTDSGSLSLDRHRRAGKLGSPAYHIR